MLSYRGVKSNKTFAPFFIGSRSMKIILEDIKAALKILGAWEMKAKFKKNKKVLEDIQLIRKVIKGLTG